MDKFQVWKVRLTLTASRNVYLDRVFKIVCNYFIVVYCISFPGFPLLWWNTSACAHIPVNTPQVPIFRLINSIVSLWWINKNTLIVNLLLLRHSLITRILFILIENILPNLLRYNHWVDTRIGIQIIQFNLTSSSTVT